tara:strand:- start:362 stop:925 length:564 start_codon:yes stop_codon:yes gene_type:complete
MEYWLDNLKDECPVMITKLPKEIMEEIDSWVNYCREIKSHPLFMLRNHENYGVNSYQLSIPPRMLQESFWLALTLRMTAALCGGYHRDYKIRTWDGHFDWFDVWLNFSYKGDHSPQHRHSGSLSGVIYCENPDLHPIHFPEYNVEFSGERGNMILFPSEVEHEVKEQLTNNERVTIAFNIIHKNDAN